MPSLNNFVVNQNFKRISESIIAKFYELQVSTLGHLTDKGFIHGLSPLTSPCKLVGSALTVRIPHLDSTAVHLALDFAQPGDVIVVSTSGDINRACWGGLVSYQAKKKNIAGAIIDGPICDIEEIKSLGFKVFSRGHSALTTRILGIEGEIGVDIAIDGVVIHSGDLVFADEDGVAIIRPEEAENIAEILKAKEDEEIGIKKEIDNGRPLSDISGAAKFYLSRQ